MTDNVYNVKVANKASNDRHDIKTSYSYIEKNAGMDIFIHDIEEVDMNLGFNSSYYTKTVITPGPLLGLHSKVPSHVTCTVYTHTTHPHTDVVSQTHLNQFQSQPQTPVCQASNSPCPLSPDQGKLCVCVCERAACVLFVCASVCVLAV